MTQSGESKCLRFTLTWDARIVGFADVPSEVFARGGPHGDTVFEVAFKPYLCGDALPGPGRAAWADLLANYVRTHGQPWNEMTRFAIKMVEVDRSDSDA